MMFVQISSVFRSERNPGTRLGELLLRQTLSRYLLAFLGGDTWLPDPNTPGSN
jgi:hypothetical protein